MTSSKVRSIKKPDLSGAHKSSKPLSDNDIEKFVEHGTLTPEIELAEIQVAFPLRMPKSLHKRLKTTAAGIEDKTTMNNLINMAISKLLDNMEQQKQG